MLGCGWWTPVARHKVEDGPHLMQDAVAFGEMASLFERYPCSLVLSIAALDLLVHAFLHLSLQNAGSCRFVVVGHLQDVGGVDPVVGASAHNMVAVDIAFVHRNLLAVSSLSQTCKCTTAGFAVGHVRERIANIAVGRRVYLAIWRRRHGGGPVGEGCGQVVGSASAVTCWETRSSYSRARSRSFLPPSPRAVS